MEGQMQTVLGNTGAGAWALCPVLSVGLGLSLYLQI